MAIELPDLRGRVRIDTSDLDKLAGRTSASLGKVAGAVGGAFAGFQAADFLKGAVDAASDLGENLSKVQTVFGAGSKTITAFAKSADAIGLSDKAALDAVGTFGNMFDQLGIGGEKSADLSEQMVRLAADLGSFHNADITDVIAAQTAAFRGEYDSLQRFIPTINAAAVEQKALQLTGKKTTKELTLQEKALAVQTLMMEGAGKAAGDFERTSGSLANKQRVLSARFEDTKAKLGQALIPVVSKAADLLLNDLGPAVSRIAEKVMPKLEEASEKVVAVIRKNWPQIKKVITEVLETVRTVVEGVVDAVTTLWENFGDNILSFVRRVWPPIAQIIKGVMETIRGIIKTITALIHGDWSEVWNGIKSVISGVWSAIQGIIKGALEIVRLAVGAALEVLGSMFKGAWDGIKNTVSGAVESIVGFFSGLGRRISDAAGDIWGWVSGFAIGTFEGVLNAIIGGFEGALNFAIDLVNKAIDAVDKTLGPWINLPEIGNIHIGRVDLTPEVVGSPLPGSAIGGTRNRFADGGIAKGIALLGERGPELVNFGSPSRVQSTAESMRLLGGRGGNININVSAPELAKIGRDIANELTMTQLTYGWN